MLLKPNPKPYTLRFAFFYILLMKKIIFILALFAGVSFANANNFGPGLWVSTGTNWGIDLKHLVGSDMAWDIYLGDFRIGDESAVGISFGYYFVYNVIKVDASTVGKFPLHWGPNAGLGIWSGGSGAGAYSGIDAGVNLAGGVSWFLPTSFKMDLSLEVLTPSFGMWRESRKQDNGKWKAHYDPAIGLKGDLGLRLLFHAYLF
jgi:hypothetical protein